MDERMLRLTNKVLPDALERWGPAKLGDLRNLRTERLPEVWFSGLAESWMRDSS